MRMGALCPGPPVLIPKITSLPLKPNRDTSYVSCTTTPHFCSVKTSHSTNQLPHTYVREGFRSNVNQFLSYESTRASLRSIFGSGSARREVGKLVARPEYFNKMPNDLAEIATYMRERASRDHQTPKEFTIHRSCEVQGPERAESNISQNSLTPTTGPNLARNPAASEGQSVKFVTDPSIPTSISALLSRRHAITRLPGAGRIGVSAAGTSSVKMMTTNNAPELIVSNVNNNGPEAPAAFTH